MRFSALILTLITGVSASIVHASNLTFLSSTAIGALTDKEKSSLTEFVVNALDSYEELEKSKWESKRGSTALFKVLADYKQGEQDCRRVKFALRSGKQKQFQTMLWNLCKNGGKWQKVEAPLSHLTDEQRQRMENDLFETLESGSDKHAATYHYADIGLKLVATPFSDTDEGSNKCRSVSVTILDQQSAMLNGSYRFCFDAKEGWTHTPN